MIVESQYYGLRVGRGSLTLGGPEPKSSLRYPHSQGQLGHDDHQLAHDDRQTSSTFGHHHIWGARLKCYVKFQTGRRSGGKVGTLHCWGAESVKVLTLRLRLD